MKAEANCSLACIALTLVLLGGSIIYRFWKRGWWVHSAVALVFGLYFAKEGVAMIRWAGDPEFNGGCCNACAATQNSSQELSRGQPDNNRCNCCMEKQSCKEAAQCMCPTVDSIEEDSRQCRLDQSDGLDCCQKATLLRQLSYPSAIHGVDGQQREFHTMPRECRETLASCSDNCRRCGYGKEKRSGSQDGVQGIGEGLQQTKGPIHIGTTSCERMSHWCLDETSNEI